MRQNCLKIIHSLLLAGLVQSVVWATPVPYSFRGETLQLNEEQVEGQTYISLDSKETQRLVLLCNAQLQYSSNGSSAYFYASGLNTFWSDRADTVTINSQDVPTLGRFLADRKLLSRQALFSSLGLSSYPQAGGQQLLPLITSIRQEVSDNAQSPIVISCCGIQKPKVVQPSEANGPLLLEFGDVGWPTEMKRKFVFSEVTLEAEGGDGPGKPLVIRATPRPFWASRFMSDLGGKLSVVTDPKHFGRAPETRSQLSSVRRQDTADESVIQFFLDSAIQFSWALQGDNLILELANTNSNLLDAGMPAGVSLQPVRDTAYPITRVVVPIGEHQAFDFSEGKPLAEGSKTLELKILPKANLPKFEPQGQAVLPGFNGGEVAVIVIDPGHGGGDPGCRNYSLQVYEKDVTLDISLRLQKILQNRGWTVVMTRSEDRDVTYAGSPDMMELEARSGVANSLGADMFVSIHCNASVNSGARGSAVYYYKDEDYPLAQSLDVLGSSLGFAEQGVLRERFAVLRTSNMPSVLVETAFLTNPTEGAMLANPSVRQAIAERLAVGLDRYVQNSPRPSRKRRG